MNKFIGYLIALIVLGAAAYFIYIHAPRLEAPVMATSTGEQVGEGTQRVIHEETDTYTIDVKYEHVDNAVIDAKIDAAVQKAVDAFKADAAQMGSPETGFPKYGFQGESTDVYTGGDITSERINLYQDTGGAHGLPIVLTLNYDTATGEEISLDRALALTGMTLAQVSQRSLSQLHQEFGDTVFDDGAAPKEENFSTFLVGPYNVTFIFQAYQVVAYAAGMPEITFARK
ncbi:MAG TPA: DUF4163 domain-containing protein [Candidatus Paceibacterota bacterium]|nr:DUF4163 domain-containing protein [Candidatus Paceibacterota bacterium]